MGVRRQHHRRSICGAALLAFAGTGICCFSALSFAGVRPRARSLTARAALGQYPSLSKLEDLILESCTVKEGDEGIECMEVYSKLVEAHFKAQTECDVNEQTCSVLLVLDRLAWGTSGTDGLALLWQMRESVEAFQQMYTSWGDAFDAVDLDGSGSIDQEELGVALRKLNPEITDMTIGRLFRAADTNLDGVIDPDEFSDFLMAGAVAAEPLKQLVPDHKRHEGGSAADLMTWATKSAMRIPVVLESD
eukprot:gb/GFBE01083140.1/.p1 GENE.gb/GFBE01083140.1/~~gb/GFBE01083140.1/.p1  ORF type:complete len:248 (+),score=51.39 gb/GFBE01083140.1/:1-744(+)